MKKSLELTLTTAWQHNAKWLTALRPLSKLYGIASDFNKAQYEHGKKSAYHAPIPVLVIGNITVGGSGKTPLIIALVQYLQTKGVQVGVISRGYGGDERLMPSLVTASSTPNQVGDEPCLIVGETGVAMAVCPNRQGAIELLLSHYPQLQLIISDDGLQHYQLYRDDEWIIVDSERGFGNGKLFPEGFLREPIERLKNSTVIYHFANEQNARASGDDNTCFLTMGELKNLLDSHQIFDKKIKKVNGLTGIGYPTRFFNSLKNFGLEVIENSKPDHYPFELSDIQNLQNYPIMITSKDAVKIRQLVNDDNRHFFDNVWILPVKMHLSKSVYQLMDKFLSQFVEKAQ